MFVLNVAVDCRSLGRELERNCRSPAEMLSRSPVAIEHRTPTDALPAAIEKFRKLGPTAEQERVNERNDASQKRHDRPGEVKRSTDRLASEPPAEAVELPVGG